MMETPYLTFTLHGSLYALDALLVREIIWLPELTTLTILPSHIAGVVNHRGHIVPVIDLGRRLGFPAGTYQISDQVIVFERKGLVMGLIVNEVLDACAIPTQEIEAIHSSEIGVDPRMRFITHVAKHEGGIVMLLDIKAVIHDHQAVIEQIEEASDQDSQVEVTHQTGHDRYFFPGSTPADRALLRERAINIRQPAEHQDVSGHTSVAVVRLNHEYFGVDLAIVQEFAEIRDIVPIPCCPEFIIGNMNLRGDVLTLIDIRGILHMGVGDGGLPPKVIVTRVENLLVGVLVDDVTDSILLNPQDIMAIPSTVKGKGRREGFLKGTAPYGGGVLSLLDLRKLLMSGELMVDEQI